MKRFRETALQRHDKEKQEAIMASLTEHQAAWARDVFVAMCVGGAPLGRATAILAGQIVVDVYGRLGIEPPAEDEFEEGEEEAIDEVFACVADLLRLATPPDRAVERALAIDEKASAFFDEEEEENSDSEDDEDDSEDDGDDSEDDEDE